MKLKHVFLFISLSLPFLLQAQDSKKKHQILILGSYHMNNPGLDVHNLEADDVLAEKRQKEIQQVVDMLAKFRPTKIALERRWQTKSDTLAQERYANYLKDSHELSRGEDQQIGFRLAKQLGHKRIYNIDAPGEFGFEEMVGYAQANGQGEFFNEINAWMTDYMAKEKIFMEQNTIAAILRKMNQPAQIKASHGIYVSMLQIGKGKDYPGAKLVADWYERNLKIHSNLTRITTEPEERILVIFGAGHAPILRELIKFSPDHELIEVSTYLK